MQLLLLLATLTCQSVAPDEGKLRWVDLKAERTVVEEVERALKDQRYTSIREIGVFRSSALVLTAFREEDDRHPPSPPHYDLMTAYTVDRQTGKATEIWQGYDWRMIETERFEEDSAAPDLLFTYESCMECEPTTLITSFHFDSRTQSWRARWPEKDRHPGAPVDAEVVGVDFEVSYAYAVVDVDGDRYPDIAVWTREAYDDKQRPARDYLDVYTVKAGEDRIVKVTQSRDKLRLKRAICNAEGWPSRARWLPMCKPFVKQR